jgi:hypothetical protein
MVLHHQPPPGAAEAEWEAAEDVGGNSTTRAPAEDQGFERSQAEGRTRGFQLHEEKGTTAEGV